MEPRIKAGCLFLVARREDRLRELAEDFEGRGVRAEVISADPKPNVLVIHSPDLNSFSKLLKRAQKDGIYVILIDNPQIRRELPHRRLAGQRRGAAGR